VAQPATVHEWGGDDASPLGASSIVAPSDRRRSKSGSVCSISAVAAVLETKRTLRPTNDDSRSSVARLVASDLLTVGQCDLDHGVIGVYEARSRGQQHRPMPGMLRPRDEAGHLIDDGPSAIATDAALVDPGVLKALTEHRLDGMAERCE